MNHLQGQFISGADKNDTFFRGSTVDVRLMQLFDTLTYLRIILFWGYGLGYTSSMIGVDMMLGGAGESFIFKVLIDSGLERSYRIFNFIWLIYIKIFF